VLLDRFIEDGLRKQFPIFKGLGGYQFIEKDPIRMNEYDEGRFAGMTTPRELWERYKRIMVETELRMIVAVVFGIGALVSAFSAFTTGSIFWMMLLPICAGAAAFFYRHSYGRYGDFADYEYFPLLMPDINIFETQQPDYEKHGKVGWSFEVPSFFENRKHAQKPAVKKEAAMAMPVAAQPAPAQVSMQHPKRNPLADLEQKCMEAFGF
jgi:hypothetical protein